MDKFTIFDPSIFSSNLGDYIIMDFCNEELSKLLPDMMQVRLPTQQSPSFKSFRDAENSKYKIVCGTNLLSSHVNRKRNQWKCDLVKIRYIKGAILMGVGWWQYQPDPPFIVTKYYQHVLHPEIIHSTRDSYTEMKMHRMGFRNVINTGCPTAWNLTKDFCKTIPVKRSDTVLFTITDYKPNFSEDHKLVSFLCENYDHLYVWPQRIGDIIYIKALIENVPRDIKILGANLYQLRKFMEDTDFDYIGTRLHAGILSLNHRKRTMIIAVDNRAAEMKTDVNLPVVSRGDLNSLKTFVQNEFVTDINIKIENIDLWRNQFK